MATSSCMLLKILSPISSKTLPNAHDLIRAYTDLASEGLAVEF